MRQFGTIFSFELQQYFKKKIFVGITIFLVVLIAVVLFFPRLQGLISFGGADDDAAAEERAVMLVKADTPENETLVAQTFAAAFPDYQVEATQASLAEIEEQIQAEQAECAVVLEDLTTYTYYVKNLSIYDANPATIQTALQSIYRLNMMLESGMTLEQAQTALEAPVQGTTKSLGVDQMQNYWYTYIMIFALYMVIILYGQMVATNVATEKSSRAMEVLVTSAKPVSMMFGKVLASCLAGLAQLVVVFGAAIVCFQLNASYWDGNMIVASIFNMPVSLFLFMLVFFVLGFFIYAFLYGAIGSTASKLEDINTSVMPITILFVVAFVVVMFSLSSSNVETPLMLVCSYVPFTSPMAMFTRIAMSTVPWYEIAISIAILIGSVVGVGVLSAKIYRVGVLLYGTQPKLGAILKAVWRA